MHSSCKWQGKTISVTCERQCMTGSNYCFWHSPVPKNSKQINILKKEHKVESIYVFGRQLVGADFKGLKLVEAMFGNGKSTNLNNSDFSSTDLWRSSFQGSSETMLDLREARFDSANLLETSFKNVRLDNSSFTDAVLIATTFRHTSLKGVLLGEARSLEKLQFDEILWENDKVNQYERDGDWGKAQRVYIVVKQAYARQGDMRMAGDFFYREMECRRKSEKKLFKRLEYTLLFLFWGYGEMPFRVLAATAAGILLFSMLYYAIDPTTAFLKHLYFSAASFTALGYGSWISSPPLAIRILSILEAFLGIIMIGSFLVTLTRKMVR